MIHDWAIELVHRLGGKVDKYGSTALIKLFYRNLEKTDFNSDGFKLLWEKEKNIKVDELKEEMRKKPELKEKVIAAIPDATTHYNIF